MISTRPVRYQYLIVLKDLLSYGQAFERVKLLLIMMIRDHATSPRILQQRRPPQPKRGKHE